MSRDVLRAADAIGRAKGLNSGLDALVSLMLGCNDADVPDGKSMAELIWAVQQEMAAALTEAERHLRQ